MKGNIQPRSSYRYYNYYVFRKKHFKSPSESPNQKVLIRGDVVYNDDFTWAVRR